MKRYSWPAAVFPVLVLLLLLSGCAEPIRQPDVGIIRPPVMPPGAMIAQDEVSLRAVERNRTIEDDPDWIEWAYKRLRIRPLSSVAEKEYADFGKYLDEGGTAYIIVHPAYFSFFHYRDFREIFEKYKEKRWKDNVIDLFISLKPPSSTTALLQAQERRTRDFVEYMSTRKRLIIFVLPRDYTKFKGYVYRKSGDDEYMRYLNEISNESESVLYVESRSPSRGYLHEEELIRLMDFMTGVGAKRIMVGGGYIGRCLESFYVDFAEEYGADEIYIVPELSDVSPKDLTYGAARELLNLNGTINVENATRNLLNDAYEAQDLRPKVRNLFK